ncbi:hypothetical protein CLOM_g12519 [Closterium sp. NIES-68]|nr:hypothetical protein CLOM_g12519 [Closterium sp. NIES-68]GJP74992.1 hypothetical protein CLOP_g5491 [Closterium sp. NIES-67]
MGGLVIYLHPASQPCRAVSIFLKLNDIEYEERIVNLMKGEHRQPAYKEINPHSLVPAMDDGGFKLNESHAILKYIIASRPCKEAWYPRDVQKRARVDALLDWHHSNTRRNTAGLVFNEVVAAFFGVQGDQHIAAVSHRGLQASLSTLENVMLAQADPADPAAPKFLDGSAEPTLADLCIACELTQLELMGPAGKEAILGDYKKVQAWQEAVRAACNPAFDQVHETVKGMAAQIAAAAAAKEDGEAGKEGETTSEGV